METSLTHSFCTYFYVAWKISEAYDVPKLAQQTVFAYDAIISGGRTPLVMKREKGWPVFGGSSYHIDADLFRATLCYVGPAQFVTNILKRFLKAALTPNGRRAGTSMSSSLEFYSILPYCRYVCVCNIIPSPF